MLDPLYPDIALYGAPGAGKSTALAYVVRLGFVRVSFAGYHTGGVRHVVGSVYGRDRAEERPLLNAVGMAGRAIDEDFWVRPMLREVDRQHAVGMPVANDDMRGENEWSQLGAHGFVRVHIVADDQIRQERLRLNGKLEGSDAEFLYRLEDSERYHPDYVIVNNAPVETLELAVNDVLNIERSKRA